MFSREFRCGCPHLPWGGRMSSDTAPQEWSWVGAGGLSLPLNGGNGPLAAARVLCHCAFCTALWDDCFSLCSTLSHTESSNYRASRTQETQKWTTREEEGVALRNELGLEREGRLVKRRDTYIPHTSVGNVIKQQEMENCVTWDPRNGCCGPMKKWDNKAGWLTSVVTEKNRNIYRSNPLGIPYSPLNFYMIRQEEKGTPTHE